MILARALDIQLAIDVAREYTRKAGEFTAKGQNDKVPYCLNEIADRLRTIEAMVQREVPPPVVPVDVESVQANKHSWKANDAAFMDAMFAKRGTEGHQKSPGE